MTATLKNTPQGYVLIVYDKPKLFQWYADDVGMIRINYINDYDYWASRPDYRCIIASETPLEGVKGIRYKCYDTDTDRYIEATSPKEYVKLLIDTEVQATEHEEYYLIIL